MNFQIKKASCDKDCEIMVDLITKLAIYEKALDQVLTTKELLNLTLFQQKYGECYLVFLDEIAIGMALYYFQYDLETGNKLLYLEDLFVLPEYRNKGCGKLLLKFLCEESIKLEVNRMKWIVLDWNTSAQEFYKKINGQFMHNIDYIRYAL